MRRSHTPRGRWCPVNDFHFSHSVQFEAFFKYPLPPFQIAANLVGCFVALFFLHRTLAILERQWIHVVDIVKFEYPIAHLV